MTCCVPSALMRKCHIHGKGPQQAWREKVTSHIIFEISYYDMTCVLKIHLDFITTFFNKHTFFNNSPDNYR